MDKDRGVHIHANDTTCVLLCNGHWRSAPKTLLVCGWQLHRAILACHRALGGAQHWLQQALRATASDAGPTVVAARDRALHAAARIDSIVAQPPGSPLFHLPVFVKLRGLYEDEYKRRFHWYSSVLARSNVLSIKAIADIRPRVMRDVATVLAYELWQAPFDFFGNMMVLGIAFVGWAAGANRFTVDSASN